MGKLPHLVKPQRKIPNESMWSFRNWRRARVLKRARLDEHRWQSALSRVALTRGFSADELCRLRELVILFLHEKSVEAAGEVTLDDDMRLVIAIQACVPILNLGLDYYAGWYAVIVYPQQFRPQHEFIDDADVVHVEDDWKMGETWEHGPVILSWDDV
ncbi:MAG: zinc-dependent peptidase, partial [Gammaproteobacteria bacterium]|nr:zinc-dependent peptidase [Gammaproteobacteria bacterium]